MKIVRHMIHPRAAVGALSVLAAVVLLNPVASAQITESVFAKSYVTSGATSTINGAVLSGAATTLGAGATVSGTVTSGNALAAGTAQSLVFAEQVYLNGQTPTGPVLLAGNIATDITFYPGVKKVTGLLTVTAGKTITLDAGGASGAEFIFNIDNYLAFGAGVNVVVINDPSNNARVVWNAGNYITVGANADIVGTLMANGYVSTGASSVVSGGGLGPCGGAVYSATSYVSLGAGATVGADSSCGLPSPPTPTLSSVMALLTDAVFADSYVTSGATSTINGNVLSGAATTLGAASTVFGTINSGAAITLGAGAGTAPSGGTNAFLPLAVVDIVQGQVQTAQDLLSGLTPFNLELPGNIATDDTFTAGVYNFPGLLTVTAGKTITLDALNASGAEFIFNIDNYLAFGAGVNVVVINDPSNNARVVWNAGNYITVGANADILGTLMAKGYVSTGAGSVVGGMGFDSCGGGVYSAASYVSLGAGATVDCN